MIINSSPPMSTKVSPFRLLTNLNMRKADEYNRERGEVRSIDRDNILAIQLENCKTYDSKRNPETVYKLDNLVAIKRAQFGSAFLLSLLLKFSL